MSKQSDVLIIIPAYNEEEVIVHTIRNLQLHCNYDYIIVDDGSKDRTPHIIKEHGLNSLRLPINLGIGSSMQTGYKYAYRQGYDYAVQLDADGQHDGQDVARLIEEIRNSDYDMVIGSRYVRRSSYKGSISRRIGIYYFHLLLRLLTGHRIYDPTSGYRIVNRKVIEQFASYYSMDYPEVESIVTLVKNKFRVREISVEMNRRKGGISSINWNRSIYYMLKVTMVSIIRRSF